MPKLNEPLPQAVKDKISESNKAAWVRRKNGLPPPDDSWARQQSPCGCHAINIAQPVTFCPLHAAAPALVDALEAALAMFKGSDREHALVNIDSNPVTISEFLATALESVKGK